MPRLLALRRRLTVLGLGLVIASLASCGQVGKLFLRMPDVEFPPQAPIIVGEPRPIFLPAGVTLPVPVSATRPTAADFNVPAAATSKLPAAATYASPAAVTSSPPAAATNP